MGLKESNPNQMSLFLRKRKRKMFLLGLIIKERHLKELKKWKKYPPAGNWHEFTKIKVNYTYLVKDWSYDDHNFIETFLIPFGMLKALEWLYSNKKTYHSCSVWPESVKQELGLSEEE